MWTVRIVFSLFAFVAIYVIFSANQPGIANPQNENEQLSKKPLPPSNQNSSFQPIQNTQPVQNSTPTVQRDIGTLSGRSQQTQRGDGGYGIELAADGSYLINKRCRVQLLKEVEMPSLEAGQIKKIYVKENDLVQTDADLANLRDEAAKLQKEIAASNIKVAQIDAENENRIKFAKESKEVADDLFAKSAELYSRGSMGGREFKQVELEAKQTSLQLDEAMTQKKQAMEKLALENVNMKAANDLINRHIIKSACDGQVAEIYVEEGEWVNRGDKVMRIIQMHRLSIDGRANSDDMFESDLKGKRVTVTQTLPDKTVTTLQGVVSLVRPENSVSNKIFFEVEIENQRRGNSWLLRPNSEVDIKVHLK